MSKINLNCGIYQIRNLITGYCLTGQSTRLKKRPSEHWNDLKNNRHDNDHFQRSYNRHGKEFFVFEILMYCNPEDLTYYEQLFYDIDKAHGLSYNIRKCVDSNRGLKCKEETKNKISKAQKGKNGHMWGKMHSPETIKKMSEALKGENHPLYGKFGKDSPNYGRKNTPETIKRMSKVKIGKNNPMYGLRGKDSPLFGKHPSLETRKKMSEANKGKKSYWWGKHHSKKTLKKMSDIKKGINNPRIMPKEIVLKILKLLNKGVSAKDISKKLSVGQNTVYKTKNGFYDDIYDLKNADILKDK